MTVLDELQTTVKEQALPRRARRLIIMLASVCAVLLVLPSVIFGWRLHTQTEFIAADQAADQQRDADYQELFEACAESDDCEIGDVPSPEEVEQTAPDPADVANIDEPATVVVTERLSQAEIAEIADEAIADCVASGECVGPQGEPAPPTDPADLARIVSAYCETGACDPTFDVVLGALQVLCADGACRGDPGAAAPAPTAEQMLAAVQSCFASGACIAPRGEQGIPGVDGRGIASLVCDDAGRWQVTYTDGSPPVDAGSCRAPLVVPDPEPEPTPSPEPTPDPISLLP